jgi:hypothetical protein
MTDRLDEILRRDARAALDDDGFAAGVMSALPAPARRPHGALQPALIFGSTALGCLLAALLAPAGFNVAQGFIDLAQLKGLTPAAFSGLAMAAVLLVSAVVLAAEID